MPSFEIDANKMEFFRCIHCRLPYAQNDISLDALFLPNDFLVPVQKKTVAAQHSIEKMCRTWRIRNRGQLELLANADNRNEVRVRSFEMLWIAANPTRKLPTYTRQGRCLLTSAHSNKSELTSIKTSLPQHTAMADVLVQLRILTSQIKSINRHLQKLTGNVCGHTRPIRSDFGYDSDKGGRRNFLLFSATDCHCCAALSMWRAKQCMVFAIITRIEERLRRGKEINVEKLLREMASSPSSAAAAYAAFGWTLFFYADSRGAGRALPPNLKCIVEESPGQTYRRKGMLWVDERDPAWTVISREKTAHICIKEDVLLGLLRVLRKLTPKEDICSTRWRPETHGIWHQELAESRSPQEWVRMGLL